MEEVAKLSSYIPKSSQDTLGRYLSKWRNARVSKEIRPPFLDIACGNNILARKVSPGFGIDIVNYGEADIIVKDLSKLPFKNGSFESAAIVASVNYFGQPEKVLLETGRVLKSGGILILTLINPFVGRIWHMLREPWAKYPGFSFDQLELLINGTDLTFTKRSRFMLGFNNLYIFTKS